MQAFQSQPANLRSSDALIVNSNTINLKTQVNHPADGLKAAHSEAMPFQRDGCYFLHKEGNYDTEGLTPLALVWKDPACSQYFIDTDAEGVVPPYQHLILRYADNATVCTADEPPVSLGKMPASFSEGLSTPLRSVLYHLQAFGSMKAAASLHAFILLSVNSLILLSSLLLMNLHE